MSRRGREAGSAALELAVLGPALLLVLGLVVVGARLEVAGGAVEQAAAAGARAASLARDSATATREARAAVRHNLRQQNVSCNEEAIEVDTGAFEVMVGQDAAVVVVVGCTVSLADQALPGLPGSRRLESRAVSPLDTYRGR